MFKNNNLIVKPLRDNSCLKSRAKVVIINDT